MRTIEAGSTETLGPYDPPTGLPADPTTLTAQIAVGAALDETSAWDAAEWDADGKIVSSVTYGAVGSGAAVEIEDETPKVWVRVGDTPDRPIAYVERLWVKQFDAAEATFDDGGGAVVGPDAVIEDGGGA